MMLSFFGKHKKALSSIIVRTIALLFLSFIMLTLAVPVYADLTPEEKSFLLMYFKEEELEVISATRSLTSITRVAENIEVVTKEDIELMNAHTLADVLNTVNGVQVPFGGSSPGNQATVEIQGSEFRHVAVFLDGIPLHNLSNNLTDIGSIPVQMIEKIEIIKGPASSAWGSSLGGVINIITKSPPAASRVNGTLSASYGERNTGDFRAEISGKTEGFGFYVSAGRLQTDGFRPENDASDNNIYAKLSYDLSSKAHIFFTTLYGKVSRGDFEDVTIDLFGRDKNEHLHSSLSLNAALSSEVSFNVSLWLSRLDLKVFNYQISDGSQIFAAVNREDRYGASARFVWNHDMHSVVIGSEYDDGTLKSDVILDGKQELRQWAVYANDTIALGKFSITPGIRYDTTNSNGSFVSPSLGMTYELTKKTLLRAYVARGFSIPPLNFTFIDNVNGFSGNPNLKVEKVWSYQAGIETGAFEYFWLKLSAFRHDIKDGIVLEMVESIQMDVNANKLRRQGFEVELKTLPVCNTSLFAAAAYIWTKDRETGQELEDVPKYTYHIALQYDDKRSFRALLQGNYIWWNMADWHMAHYSSFIFNLNLIKTLYQQKTNRLEAFVTAHNIFNGSQYWDFYYKNAKRWFEGGLRYKF
jgi:vitamin B12 transporter